MKLYKLGPEYKNRVARYTVLEFDAWNVLKKLGIRKFIRFTRSAYLSKKKAEQIKDLLNATEA